MPISYSKGSILVLAHRLLAKDGITCCIQVSAKVAIGVPINPASSFNNPQYDITILAWKASYIIRAMYRSINYTDCSRNICRGAKS
ncbi:hypothetical protein SUGI_0812310 [Cryptomeria japonica]|nr:hypothetical protein SUGI_0812310 [Cryptomeria japonica]